METDLRETLGKNLRKFRLFRKLSQAELAEKVDISNPFLSDIENGKKWVSPVTLARLASALDVQAHELLRTGAAIPENAPDGLEKYTDDIFIAIGESLDKLRDGYLRQMEDKRGKS